MVIIFYSVYLKNNQTEFKKNKNWFKPISFSSIILKQNWNLTD
jgi:hypothetical protein